MMRRQQDQYSKAFNELSDMILNILRYPQMPIEISDQSPSPSPSPPSSSMSEMLARFPSEMTPAAFASLLLGISLALMLCGSVTFFIGFLMMPWVLVLVIFFYFAGILSSLSVIGLSVLCHISSSLSSRKHVQPWKLM